MNIKAKTRLFRRKIIHFWKFSGRKDLPWRQTKDPWKLLIAEVLLRKTTSSQAAVAYLQLQMLGPKDIIDMKIVDLVKILTPLGIQKVRARQLKEISGKIMSFDKDEYESDKSLRSLPGVGKYISNAVRCFAFGFPVPALDTNMIRILERVFAWHSNKSRAREDVELWKFAEALMPKDKSREFNWGILDFGALICTARNPKCNICPINNICLYYQSLSQSTPI